MKHDDELIQIFVEEANDILENVNSFFESWQNDLSQDEMLVAILRDLHTFKGSARMVGFTSLSECIHCLEQIIQKIHEGKIYSSGDIIEEIQFSLDFINSFIEAVAKAKSIPNTEVVLNRLKEITRSDQPEDPKTENQIDRVEIGTQPASDVVRVKADLLEEFSKLAGQVNVTRSHLEEQVGRVDDSLVEMAKEIKVIQEKMRNLQVKTDASLSLYHAAVTEKGNEEFDILELDRYSFLQEMTRMLIDKVNVLESLNSLNLSTMQNVEGLLVEQGRAARNLESGISHTRMISIEHLVPRLKRIVRQVSNELGKEVHLECIKAQGEVDRKILEKLIPALEHMVRNAIDHGIEPPNERARLGKHKHGVITLSLFRFGNEIVIQLGDDGKGIDIEKVKEKAIEKKLWDPQATFSKLDAIQMISLPGFSTKDVITPISGRGVGMDVVHAEVSKLGGTLEIESFSHQGTQFTIRVPFTLSLNQALILIAGTQHYAMLLSNLVAISRLSVNEIDKIMNEENHQINYAKQSYELFYLTELLNEKKMEY